MARIGVDLDGVVYDFVGALRDYLTFSYGRDPADFPSPTKWEMPNEWGMSDEQFDHLCNEATDREWLFVYGEPIPGAVDALKLLRSQGNSVHVITSRNFGRKSESNTRLWLDRHGIPRQSLTFAHDKSVLDADIFIDDKPANVDHLNASGKVAYLFKDPSCPLRVDWVGHSMLCESWDQFIELVSVENALKMVPETGIKSLTQVSR